MDSKFEKEHMNPLRDVRLQQTRTA